VAIPWQAKWGMGWGALRRRLFGARVPLNVMLAVTDRCTNRCAYCRIPERARPDPPLAQLLQLIDDMHRAGTRRLGIWGGEPLVRDDLGRIIDAAKRHHLYVTLDTNGALVEKRLPELLRADHIVVAYDGLPEAHDANRCRGSHEKARRALEILAPRMDTWTITVLTKHNLGSIDHILDLAEELGFACTFQVVHHNSLLGAPVEDFLPDQRALRTAIGHIIERREAGARIASSREYLEYLRAWPDFRSPQREHPVGGLECLAGQLFANVDVDGAVYPCSLLVGAPGAPNAFDMGFARAFAALSAPACQACNASCYVEYNHLFALDPAVIRAWTRAMRKKR